MFSQWKQITSKVLKPVLLNTFVNGLESITSKVSGVATKRKLACNVTTLESSTFATVSTSGNVNIALKTPLSKDSRLSRFLSDPVILILLYSYHMISLKRDIFRVTPL